MYRLVVSGSSLRSLILLASLSTAFTGCERRHGVIPLEPPTQPPQVRFDPITQLLPNRITHVIVDLRGNLYWVQETADGQDVLFVIGNNDLPHATNLTSQNILAALGSRDARVDAGPVAMDMKTPGRRASSQQLAPSGNIQSLVVGVDGAIYFYFNGGIGRAGRQALGRFDSRTSEIRILGDTAQLGAATQMGRSLDLARGKLISHAPESSLIRLLIRHSDDWKLFDFDTRRLPATGPITLARSITSIRSDNEPLDLTRDEVDLSAGPAIVSGGADGRMRTSLLLCDPHIGAMYMVDDTGIATILASLVGLSRDLSEPLPSIEAHLHKGLADGGAQQQSGNRSAAPPVLLIFAAEGNVIDPPISSRPDPADLHVQFPALLSIAIPDGTYTAIARDQMHAPGEFAVHSVRLRQLVPFGNDALVGYDSASGQMLKLRLLNR